MRTPLVSILIPAYNAQDSLGETLQSAVSQTWPRKEIIVVDDGSRDRTAEVARRFESKEVKVVSTDNRGMCAAINLAFRMCQGDYIQELDADDLLSHDKIELQLRALRETDSSRIVLSSPWGHFFYRSKRARFVRNSLWQDLSPTEWLMRKMSENLHMQNATWLISREVAEATGPWNESLNYDQDGEYFSRMLTVAEGTRFVPAGRVYYRTGGVNRISVLGNSDKKRESLLVSMKLHIQYLRSLEDSERTRKACLTYLQNWCHNFLPDRQDLMAELRAIAFELGGSLNESPTLRPKYAWLVPVLGYRTANRVQGALPRLKSSLLRAWDKAMYRIEVGRAGVA